MIVPVRTSAGGYNIYIERGALRRAGELFDLDRRVLVVTDSGVPQEYAESVASQCKWGYIEVIPEGEKSKCMKTFETILTKLVEYGFTRTDCIVAVGGGVVGDISGFSAACFMRGIDFYNIPTTVLSQVDSSIGGKTAIDFGNYKNIVGAFWQPKGVLIDSDTLLTLPERQISNGLAESVKMALTSDRELFEIFEKSDIYADIDNIIYRSLLIKKHVVEEDEKETGIRKILNFGHTIAHAIESVNSMENLYHGECVALGMIPMCSEGVRERLVAVLEKLKLPTETKCEADLIYNAVKHDKKASGDELTYICVDEVGTYSMKKCTMNDFKNIVEKTFK